MLQYLSLQSFHPSSPLWMFWGGCGRGLWASRITPRGSPPHDMDHPNLPKSGPKCSAKQPSQTSIQKPMQDTHKPPEHSPKRAWQPDLWSKTIVWMSILYTNNNVSRRAAAFAKSCPCDSSGHAFGGFWGAKFTPDSPKSSNLGPESALLRAGWRKFAQGLKKLAQICSTLHKFPPPCSRI